MKIYGYLYNPNLDTYISATYNEKSSFSAFYNYWRYCPVYKGTVRWFKNTYGFIIGEDGKDKFVHWSAIEGDGYKTLEVGQEVTFDLTEDEKGEKAINVRKVQPSETSEPSENEE